MFKSRNARPEIIGQEMSEDELSNVIGAQQQPSRERQAFDEQVKDTTNEWIDLFVPILKPLDATVRLAGAAERLLQRSFDHDVRWPITDQEAARLEAAKHEQEEQKEKDAAAEREHQLSSNNGSGAQPVDMTDGPPGGGGFPDIPSNMINSPPPHEVQISIEPINVGGFY